MGWFIDYHESFIVVASDDQIEDLTRKLMRIGLDNILGYISDVSSVGVELQQADIIEIDEFKTYLNRDDVQVIDLRNSAEYKAGHIEGVPQVFIGTLPQNLDKISKEKPLVVHCQSGDRATIGYSLLKKFGFKNVKNFSGSMNEWVKLGNPVVTESEFAMA